MPGLKPVVDKLDDVPEAARGFYEAKDGKHVLTLEGTPAGFVPAAQLAEANGRLTEFRDNNRTMHTELEGLRPIKVELETLKTKYQGIDPVEVAGLRTKVADLEKNGVKSPDDVTARINEAINAAIKPLQTQLQEQGVKLTAAETQRAEAQTALVRKDFEGQLTQIGLKAGVDEKMLPHFVRHGLETFRLEGGKFVAKHGDTPLFSVDRPAEPLSPEEWVAKQAVDSPGFFKPSGGGGAPGSPKPGTPPPRSGSFRTPDGREVKTDGIAVLA